jgi:fibronectin-binding autotransporter adhesin
MTLSGRINIWEDDEDLERRFEIDGTGKTVITGTIRDYPEGVDEFEGEVTVGNRQLIKRGTGVLVIDVGAGDNFHNGPDVIYMGNMHYTSNDALGVGGIRSIGGAVGVDTGVSGNATFASMIETTSRGGLMLAPSDAAAPLDFTGALANAANMTVAAPDGTTPASPFSYTGTITPANSKYGLGGGTGTLRLPNAQLTGANNVELRNGGTVQLFGANTYTGSTTLLTKYTGTRQEQAAGDNAGAGTNQYYAQVAPTLEVNKLSNGGVASSIGSASSAASNLFIQGSTLRYVGTGDSTDRLFTIGTGGATIESSGSGAVNFTNAGSLGRDDVEDKLGDLDDFTGTNDSNQLYNVNDSSDIIVGMTVTDPEIGGIGAAGPPNNPVNPPGPNPPLIPGPSSILNPSPTQTTITGVSDDGRTLGLSANYGFRQKLQTRLVFGTVPRTLTLGGTNAGANTLAPVISNSAAGGVVNVAKTGAGVWILSGANTYTGTTTVSAGTLVVNGVQTGGGATTVNAGGTLGGGGQTSGNLIVASGGTVDPGAVGALAGVLAVNGNATLGGTTLIEIGGTGASQFDQLNMTGTLAAGGVFDVDFISGYGPASGHSFDVFDFTTASGGFTLSLPALGGGLSWNTSSLLTTGTLSIGGPIMPVPEPATVALVGLGLAGCWRRRREASRRG